MLGNLFVGNANDFYCIAHWRAMNKQDNIFLIFNFAKMQILF